MTLRLSGSPTQLRIKATHRRVRSKPLFGYGDSFTGVTMPDNPLAPYRLVTSDPH
jgi:hypothetical protein